MFEKIKIKYLQIVILMLAVCMSVFANAEDVNGESLLDPTAHMHAIERFGLAELSTSLGDSRYVLNSILVRENLRVAVINSKRVIEGDVIGLAKVQEINSNNVIIIVNEESKVLKLHEISIKQLSDN